MAAGGQNIEKAWFTDGYDAIPMLANLELFVPQGASPDSFYLGAVLRCGEATEASDDARIQFRVRLIRGFLEVKFHGCESVPGTHQYDRHAPEHRSVEQLVSRKRDMVPGSIEFEASGGVGSSKLAAKLHRPIGSPNRLERSSLQQQATEQLDVYHVRYRGNERGRDIWQIGGGSSAEFLDWTYLKDEHLCEIVIGSVEDCSVRASFYFYPADLEIVDVWIDGCSHSELAINKQKIMKIIVQKALMKDEGKIFLSSQTLRPGEVSKC